MNEKEKQSSFLKLLEPVHDNLSRFARGMTKNKEEARDLVSETILKAYENFEKLEKPESFRSYLFQIASRINSRSRWRLRIFDYFSDLKLIAGASNEPSADLIYDVQLLYIALNKLPEKQREALVLFEISGFTIAEISDIQGGTVSGVKSRLKRGREKLARLLGADKFAFPTNGRNNIDNAGNGANNFEISNSKLLLRAEK